MPGLCPLHASLSAGLRSAASGLYRSSTPAVAWARPVPHTSRRLHSVRRDSDRDETMSQFLTTSSVLMVALASSSLLAQEPASGSLSYRALKTFKYHLPSHDWRAVGHKLPLQNAAGLTFGVKKDGMKLLIDTTGDGRTNAKVSGLKGFAKFRAGSKDQRFEYAVQLKFESNDYKYRSACCLTGKVGDLKITLFDMNSNGRFDDLGQDAVAIGRDHGAAVLSKVVSDGEHVYELDLSEGGTQASIKPYAGKLGQIDLHDHEGRSKVGCVVVTNGQGHSFNVAGHKAFTLPTGRYTISAGLVQKGKQTAKIRAGEMAPLVVEAGKLASLRWGGQITAIFHHSLAAGTVKVEPAHVKYFGEAGEEYYDLTPNLKSPKFTVRDVNTARELGGFIYSAC